MMSTFIDTHVHFYPSFSLKTAVHSTVRACGAGNTRVWMVADRAGQDSPILWRTQIAHDNSLELRQHSERCYELVSPQGAVYALIGHQVLSEEGIEVLSFPIRAARDRELPLSKLLERTVPESAITILPWSPGKWRGLRIGHIREAIQAHGSALWIGDTPLRSNIIRTHTTLHALGDMIVSPEFTTPTHKPQVPLDTFRDSESLGQRTHAPLSVSRLVAGSDPLPRSGEENLIGTFGVCSESPFSVSAPFESVRRILREPVREYGQRNSLSCACRRWLRHRFRI